MAKSSLGTRLHQDRQGFWTYLPQRTWSYYCVGEGYSPVVQESRLEPYALKLKLEIQTYFDRYHLRNPI